MVRGIYDECYQQRMKKLLAFTHILPYANSPMEQLSVGLQKEIRIIAAYLKATRLIIQNNIFEGINSKDKEHLQNTLRQYTEHDHICIIISEDKQALSEFSDYIYCIS